MENSEEAVGLAYFMKWQTPVCALAIAIPAGIAVNLVKKRPSKTEQPLNYSDLWVPCWRKLHPRWLLVYRVMAFLTVAWLLFKMTLFSGLFAFYFYTQWTFTLVMLYFAVGIIISAQGCLRSSEKSEIKTGERDTFLINGSKDKKSAATTNSKTKERSRNLHKHNIDNEPSQKAGFLGNLMHIIYQTSAGASVLTDLVFWTILVPTMAGKQFELTLLISSIHSVNVIFMAIDSLLNALVAISISRAINSVGTSMVSWAGCDSCSMLWGIHIAGESQKYDFLKVVPTHICEITQTEKALGQ